MGSWGPLAGDGPTKRATGQGMNTSWPLRDVCQWDFLAEDIHAGRLTKLFRSSGVEAVGTVEGQYNYYQPLRGRVIKSGHELLRNTCHSVNAHFQDALSSL